MDKKTKDEIISVFSLIYMWGVGWGGVWFSCFLPTSEYRFSRNHFQKIVRTKRKIGGVIQTHKIKIGGVLQTHERKMGGGDSIHTKEKEGVIQTHKRKIGGGCFKHTKEK